MSISPYGIRYNLGKNGVCQAQFSGQSGQVRGQDRRVGERPARTAFDRHTYRQPLAAAAAVYTYAPPTYAAPTATPITLTEVRRRVNFPVYVPSYIPVELTPEPVSLSRDSSVDWLVELWYHGAAGWTVLRISMGKGGNSIAARRNYVAQGEGMQLPNGITAHYNGGTAFCNLDQQLAWEQDGTFIMILGQPTQAGSWLFSKEELVKIAASMSSTGELGHTAYPTSQMPRPIPSSTSCR